MSRPTVPPRGVYTTFMNFPYAADLDKLDAHFAIIGMPYGDPYAMDETINDQTNAPTAVRRASSRISLGLERWDFDIGGPVFDGKDIKVVDVGDVPGDPRDLGKHYKLAEEAVRKILKAGAMLWRKQESSATERCCSSAMRPITAASAFPPGRRARSRCRGHSNATDCWHWNCTPARSMPHTAC